MPIIGHSIKNFSIVSKKWNEIKYDVLYEGMKAKFLQNQNLQKQLLLTRNKKLIEGNGYDSLYGAGIWTNQITDNNYGPGKNIQGQLLMKVRNELFNHRSLIKDKKNQKFKPNQPSDCHLSTNDKKYQMVFYFKIQKSCCIGYF